MRWRVEKVDVLGWTPSYDVGHGMSTDFEKGAAFLLPTNPVAKKSKNKNVLSLRLQGSRVVLVPVGSASVGTKMKTIEP